MLPGQCGVDRSFSVQLKPKLNNNIHIVKGCQAGGISMTQYESILVPAGSGSCTWTQAVSLTGPVDSIVECGSWCSTTTCVGFKLYEGVCEMSASWIFETTEVPSVSVFREVIGEHKSKHPKTKFFINVDTCAVMAVVSQPVLDINIAGIYSYAGRTGGRPLFRHNSTPNICLFHRHGWKVDGCNHINGATPGLIFSQGSEHLNPQDPGLTWRYCSGCYGNEGPPPDSSIVVKCVGNNKFSLI